MIATNYETTPSAFRIRLQSNSGTDYRRELRDGVGTALDQGERRIVVDCSSWLELDLIVLSALVYCAKACDEQGAVFELESLRPDLWSRIDALRLGARLGLGE